MANEANSETTVGGKAVDLNAHAAKISKQDNIATVILTVIVGHVLALIAAIVIYILVEGRWNDF